MTAPAPSRMPLTAPPTPAQASPRALASLPEGVLPAGAVELARRHAATLGAVAGLPAGAVDDDALALILLAPLVVAAANGRAAPAGPPAPRKWGDGALCVDVGPDDVDTVERFLALQDPAASAVEVAAGAQSWRLPVTAYRRHGAAGEAPRDPAPPRPPTGSRLGTGVVVVDHTVMWAGPLATALLRQLGVRVVKVEPACRPDGLRGDPPLFAALNDGKSVAPLDLRRTGDRAAYLELVAEADLVVDNFSPRVAANLGIGLDVLRAVNPTVARCSLPAFPPGGPEADWVAYGPAVHAHLGLGDAGDAGFQAPLVSYPDPLAGLRAAAVMAGMLADRATGRPLGDTVTLSLAGAIAPLVSRHVPGASRPDPVALAGWVAEGARRCTTTSGGWRTPPPLFGDERS